MGRTTCFLLWTPQHGFALVGKTTSKLTHTHDTHMTRARTRAAPPPQIHTHTHNTPPHIGLYAERERERERDCTPHTHTHTDWDWRWRTKGPNVLEDETSVQRWRSLRCQRDDPTCLIYLQVISIVARATSNSAETSACRWSVVSFDPNPNNGGELTNGPCCERSWSTFVSNSPAAQVCRLSFVFTVFLPVARSNLWS